MTQNIDLFQDIQFFLDVPVYLGFNHEVILFMYISPLPMLIWICFSYR